MSTSHPGIRLRIRMDSGTVAAPGAFNALVARAIARAGFDAAYVSGGAASVAAGVPDVGLLTLEHFCRVIREVTEGSGLPVMADADTGFGEAEMTRRTVIEYHRAGAAGLHLEDQVFPKRCGHLDGKSLVPTDHMAEKIAWAVKASRDCADGAFIICARTDARGVEGMDAAIDRARIYVEAGADMIFPEGLKSEAEFGEFAAAFKGDTTKGTEASRRQGIQPGPYLLANMTEFGKTPLIPLSCFAELGYDLVIYPVTMLRVAMGAVIRALETLKTEGTVEPILDEMQSRQDLYDLVGYTPGKPWEFPG